MKLFFLRHGEAAYNKHDDIRELTARGCDDVKRVAQHQRAALADVQRVFVSPITRAQQTADMVCREAHILVPRETVDWLIHEMPLREALANMIEMEGDAFISGALHIVHHQSP